jgi:hypothetical protein
VFHGIEDVVDVFRAQDRDETPDDDIRRYFDDASAASDRGDQADAAIAHDFTEIDRRQAAEYDAKVAVLKAAS